jgi:hypothetical protein
MQPTLSSCVNALNRASDQRVRSLEDSVVTRRFPVVRGTAAGPLRGHRAPVRALAECGRHQRLIRNPTSVTASRAVRKVQLVYVEPNPPTEARVARAQEHRLACASGWPASRDGGLTRPSVEPQFAESASSAAAWSATVIPACFSAQSSAKSATSSHPSIAGSRCGPSNSTISVTVFDL